MKNEISHVYMPELIFFLFWEATKVMMAKELL